jgi:hypothetical protein
MPPPDGNASNILITGTPRSGTTLTCHLLNKVPDTVALHEPMKVKKFTELSGAEEVAAEISGFCEEQRQSIRERGVAISKHVGGAIPDNPVGSEKSEGGVRNRLASKGEIAIDRELSPGFALAVKHTAAFTALLESLVERFPVYAIVRNPLSTIASWRSVPFNVREGHVPAAERLSPELKAALEALDDPLDRQLHVLDWFHGRLRRFLPDERIIRYESIVDSGGRALAAIRPGAEALDEPLESRNLSSLYDRESMAGIGERLLETDGAYWQTYPRESVERLIRA